MKPTNPLVPNVARLVRVCALSLIVILIGGALTGCASYKVPLTYEPPTNLVPRSDTASVSVGAVNDARGTRADWLGAIRGGFGNPLKKLYTEQETALVVKALVEEGLRVRGMLSEGAVGGHRLDLTMEKFDTSNLVNGEAHAYIAISVVDLATQAVVFTKSYRTDRTDGGIGAGVFGSVNELAALANRTMNASIDSMLDDPELYAAVGGRSTLVPPGEKSTADRLKELDELLSAGLITEAEYQESRAAILKDL